MYSDLNKYKGGIVSSSDISFQGSPLTIITDIPCDQNLNEVIYQIDAKLKTLIDDSNFTTLDNKTVNFDPATASNIDILQALINDVDANNGDIITLIDELGNLDISTKEIVIDLDCLTPDAAPCATGINTYTLLTILSLFKNEICKLKNP